MNSRLAEEVQACRTAIRKQNAEGRKQGGGSQNNDGDVGPDLGPVS
jgi:hypothetical protein